MPIGSLYTDLSGSLGCARGTLFSSDDDEINDLRSEANLVAWYDASNGANLTVDSVGRVSQWNDTSMFASRHLLQGTAANQPIYLPWSGNNYGYCPGVAGNYFSTPDSAAVSVTGDLDMRARVSLADWTPSANFYIFNKYATAAQQAYLLDVEPAGSLRLVQSTNGTATDYFSSTANPAVSDGDSLWLRATLDVDNGAGGRSVTFYTSSDGLSWTQLGAVVTVATAANTFDGNSVLFVGGSSGATNPLGSIFYAEIRNGIDGTVVAAFDPSRAADGASSFVAATGETWTVNTSGGKPAQIVGRASVLFDGVDDFLLASFTLAQPSWIVLAVKQVSWTYPDAIMDGVTANTGKIAQDPPASSPSFATYAGGTFGIFSTALAIGNLGVISALFNSTNSSLAVNRGAVSAPGADVGTASMGGVTLGAQGPGNTAWSNIQVCGLALFNAAPSSRSQSRVINYMMGKYNISA